MKWFNRNTVLMLPGWLLALCLWSLPPVSLAATTCNPNVLPTTPAADFTLDDLNGTATHAQTGLTWMRCALGQTWDSARRTCTGAPQGYNWGDALHTAQGYAFAGHNDWRLPNAKEIKTIVEEQCYGPSISETVFPQTTSEWYWSSSVFASDPGYAWYVDFDDGHVGAGDKAYSYHVRLARGGQSFGDFDGEATNQTLAISKTGTGAGGVTSVPSGIDCGALCSAPFPAETPVTLTAAPNPGSTFVGWSGDCSGTAVCTVSMGTNKNITSVFQTEGATAQPDLTVGSGIGVATQVVNTAVSFTSDGTVVTTSFDITYDPSRVTPGTVINGAALAPHTVATSTPAAGIMRVLITPPLVVPLPTINTGVLFTIPWTIAATVSGNTPLTLANVVFGNAVAAPVAPGVLTSGQITITGGYTLALTTMGTGTGAVSGAGSYAAGAPVTLTATPNPGSIFTGWSPTPCAASFIMPASDLLCTATFTGTCIEHLILESEIESGAVTHTACRTITAGPAYTVAATGHVTLRAGERITLRPGFQVQTGGQLRAAIDPGLKP